MAKVHDLDHQVSRLSTFRQSRATVIAAGIVINLLGLAFPLLMLQLYDRILPSQSLSTLTLFVVGIAIALCLEALTMMARSSLTAWIAAKFEHAAMTQAMSRFLREPIQEFELKGTGEITHTLKSISGLKSLYAGSSYQQLSDLPFSLLYALIIMVINPLLGQVLLVAQLCFAGFSWWFSRLNVALMTNKAAADQRRGNFLHETLNNIHTIKSMTMELPMLRRYERLQNTCARALTQLIYRSDLSTALGSTLNPLVTVFVIGLGAYMVIHQSMSVGELAACTFLAMRSLSPLQKLTGLFAKLRQDRLLALELNALLLNPALVLKDPDDAQVSDSVEVFDETHVGAAVHISGLRYRFLRSSDPFMLFSNLSLEVQPGECIALVGRGGSGRTTLMQCVAGLLQPEAGTIKIDGQDAQEAERNGSGGRVVYLSTSAKMFDGTLLENITAFNPTRVTAALQIAQALGLTEFVSNLPRGWDTVVGNTAHETLPPGYRQRLAIVRAFASQPNLVLFDDANAEVDLLGDRLLLEFLRSIKGRVTILMVTQREDFQALADRLLALEHGQVVQLTLQDWQSQQAVATNVNAAVASSAKRFDGYFDKLQASMATTDKGLTHWQRIDATVTQQFLKGANDFSNCFSLLLKLLNARQSAREIAEVLPYYEEHMDLSEFLNSLARLGFKATMVPCALADIPESALPCLFVPAGGSSFVVLGRVGAGVRVTTSIDQAPYLHNNALLIGHAYFIHSVDIAANERQPVHIVLRRFSAQFLQSGVAELFAGLLLVTSPLFSMAIYSAVIPSGATDTLLYLGVGTALAVALSFLFTRYRIAILSLVTGRIDFLFGTMVTGQLLKMPVSYTEGASVGAQTARLHGFEAIRDMFSGPLAATMLDLPVTLVFLIVLALINPMALLVFVGVIAAYAFLYLIYEPMVSRQSDRVGIAVNARSEFLTESAHKMRLIKECGVEQTWFKRFKDISAEASMLMFQVEKTAARIGALSHLFMMLSALMIIAISVPLVISGSIGAGALVASTMLMWRILTPIQMFFSNLRRFNNIKSAVRQIDGLMGIQGERFDTTNAVSRLMAGKVEFSKVSFRYAQSADPALVGVDFTLRHGQSVALTGPDGGGKSTIIKLLLGLYPPQSGAILIDGIDIRQLTPFEIRRRIGYMPEDRSHMFRATIAQNMRLVRPDASDDDILAALELAGGLEQVLRLPNKLQYRSGDNKQDLSISTRRKFALARAYLAGASILLLDEPTSGLDPVADQKFAEFLTAVKGKITVIFVSHKPSHIRLADTLMVFENGYLRATGAPNDLLKPPTVDNGSRS